MLYKVADGLRDVLFIDLNVPVSIDFLDVRPNKSSNKDKIIDKSVMIEPIGETPYTYQTNACVFNMYVMAKNQTDVLFLSDEVRNTLIALDFLRGVGKVRLLEYPIFKKFQISDDVFIYHAEVRIEH